MDSVVATSPQSSESGPGASLATCGGDNVPNDCDRQLHILATTPMTTPMSALPEALPASLPTMPTPVVSPASMPPVLTVPFAQQALAWPAVSSSPAAAPLAVGPFVSGQAVPMFPTMLPASVPAAMPLAGGPLSAPVPVVSLAALPAAPPTSPPTMLPDTQLGEHERTKMYAPALAPVMKTSSRRSAHRRRRQDHKAPSDASTASTASRRSSDACAASLSGSTWSEDDDAASFDADGVRSRSRRGSADPEPPQQRAKRADTELAGSLAAAAVTTLGTAVTPITTCSRNVVTWNDLLGETRAHDLLPVAPPHSSGTAAKPPQPMRAEAPAWSPVLQQCAPQAWASGWAASAWPTHSLVYPMPVAAVGVGAAALGGARSTLS